MALSVKSADYSTTVWASRAGAAANEYRTNVQGAGGAWQAGVDNGEQSWVAGVNQAAGSDAYPRGVAGKSAKYVDRAVNVGAGRYPGGIQAGTASYRLQIGKVLGVEAGITLPARGPAGSNAIRSTIVQDALHQAKLNGQFN